MIEEFIRVALEAFNNANGNIDKFELELRRKLMVYNSNINSAAAQQVQTQKPIISSQLENVINSFDINDPIFKELENVDINSLNDEQILALAEKMGFTNTPQEESFDE